MSEVESETAGNAAEDLSAGRERAVQDAVQQLIPRQATLPIASATRELLRWLAADEPIIGISLPADKKRTEILLSAVLAPDRILISHNGKVFQWNSVDAKVKSIKSNGVLLESTNNPEGAQQLFIPSVNRHHAREIAALFTAAGQIASAPPASDGARSMEPPEPEVTMESVALNPADIGDTRVRKEDVIPSAPSAAIDSIVDRIEELAGLQLSQDQLARLSVRDVAILEWLDAQQPIRAIAIRVSMGLPLLEAVLTDTELIVKAAMRNRAQSYVLTEIEEVKLKKSEVVVTMRTTKNARVVAGSSFGGHQKTLFLGCVSRDHAQDLARTIQAGRTRSGFYAPPVQQEPSTPAPGSPGGTSVESRLEDLERLKERGLVSADEYATHRDRILGDL